jgi:sodium transport system permease protein
VLLVARRDLVEFVRDRRALFITLLMPMAMYPVLALSSTLGVRTAIAELEAKPPSRLTLAVSGADARGFATILAELDAEGGRQRPGWPATLAVAIVRSAEAPLMLDQGQADAWIDVKSGVLAGLRADGTVPLEVKLSLKRPTGRQVQELVDVVLRAVADRARVERITRAGLPPTALEPVRIIHMKGLDAMRTTDRGALLSVLGAVLVLLALLMATGAFYPAIDAIAGEKERGTIETLLIAPCRPTDLVTGKFLAVFVVTLATLAANALSIALTASVLLRLLPAGTDVGLPGRMAGLGCVGLTLTAYVGLAAVSAALCLAVTAASKSVKEAQNTLTPVMLLVSALAGSALVPGAADSRWLAALPFAGQVAVAKSAFASATRTGTAEPGAITTLGGSLGLSLVASGVLTWLLLRFTATLLTDEEILFRGPDTAATGLRRPARRRLPTPREGLATVAAGFAALWYSQGLGGGSFPRMLVMHQAVAVVLPLLAVTWWQRVNGRDAFALRLPRGPGRGLLAAVGGACLGGGLFVLGAAALLAFKGTEMSPGMQALSAQLLELVQEKPWWTSWLLLALMPAVCEELLFRGWVLASLAGDRPSRSRTVTALVVQAACFAAFHLLPERMPQTFIVGLVLGWAVVKTGSLLPAVVGHVVHNGMPILLFRLAAGESAGTLGGSSGSGLPGWTLALAALAVVVGAGLVAAAGRSERNVT